MSSEDQANVPQTPLSVVPSVSGGDHSENTATTSQDGMPSQRGDRRVTFEQQFFPEDNGQEQNVPQQIDLTEDDDDEDDEHDLAQASEEMGEGMTEDGDEAIDIMVNDNDLVDLEDGESDEDEVEEEIVTDSDSESGSEKERADLDDDSQDVSNQDVIEVHGEDEDSFDDEEKDKVQNQALDQSIENVAEEKLSPVYGGPSNVEDIAPEAGTSQSVEVPSVSDQLPSTSSQEQKEEEPVEEEKVEETEKAKPVRITRTTRGVRPRIRRTTTITGRYRNPSARTNK